MIPRAHLSSSCLSTVQHGADLPAWFGHPDETDEPMLELSWDMTGYLMSVAISLCWRCCSELVADLSRLTMRSNFVHKLDPNGPGRASRSSFTPLPA